MPVLHPTIPRQVRLIKCALRSPGLALRASNDDDVALLQNYGFDLMPFIQKIEIYESIFDNTISGTINLLENVGLPEYLPIVGVETISVIFEVDAGDTTKQFKHVFRVIGLKDQAYPRHDARMYTLMLATHEYVNSVSSRVCRVFNSTTSDAIVNILTNDLHANAAQLINVEQTTGTVNVVIPNYTPLQAINYFSILSRTIKTPVESNFLFFETLDGFHFQSLQSIIMQGRLADIEQQSLKTFDVDSGQITSPRIHTDVDMLNSIARIHQEQSFDLMQDILGGTLRSNVVRLDFLAKQVKIEQDSRYSQTFAQTTHLDDYPVYPHNFELTVRKDARLFTVISDDFTQKSPYAKNNGYQTTTNSQLFELIALRARQLREIQHLQTLLDLPGQPDLRAGDVVNVRYPSTRNLAEAPAGASINMTVFSSPTPLYSGRHLVASVKHILTTKSPGSMEYRMHVRVNRDSFGTPLIGTSSEDES